MHWFQFLKHEDFLVFLVIHGGKLNIFGFWPVGQLNLWKYNFNFSMIMYHDASDQTVGKLIQESKTFLQFKD